MAQRTTSMKIWTLLFLLAPALDVAGETNLVSGWSPCSNQLSLRITCPERLVAGGKDQLFWVKCEVKSEADHLIWTTNLARVYLVDELGTTQRCTRRVLESKTPGQPGFDYSRPLAARQTNSWWQSARMETSGRYRLFAELDSPPIRTPPLSVQIALSMAGDFEEVRVPVLLKHFEEFPLVVPNTGQSAGAYRWVALTNDPVFIEGVPYYAFRFKAPPERLDLEWSFTVSQFAKLRWWIVARRPPDVDFGDYRDSRGEEAVPGLTRPDDLTLFQGVEPQNIEPGGEYCISFSPEHGLVKGLLLSLNFTRGEPVKYHTTPDALRDRNLYDPVRRPRLAEQ